MVNFLLRLEQPIIFAEPSLYSSFGGTHHTFQSFTEVPKDDKRKDELKNAKHGDFISRLKGNLDVQSINAVDEKGKEIPFEVPGTRTTLIRYTAPYY